jgi:hypothetical protein
MTGPTPQHRFLSLLLPLLLLVPILVPAAAGHTLPTTAGAPTGPALRATTTPVQNFSAAIQRFVALLGAAGSGLLAIVWARVALSWFSNDVGKKVQAKDRARDALIGTVLFVAALSGLVWGLAQWVVTGA